MSLKQTEWFKTALNIEGSVIPAILSRVLWCGAFGLFISVLDFYNIPVVAKALGGIVPSIVLGLLRAHLAVVGGVNLPDREMGK